MPNISDGVPIITVTHSLRYTQAGLDTVVPVYFKEVYTEEAKYVDSWPNTTSAWAGWSRFNIPVDRYGGVHSQLICTSITLRFSTC